MEQYIADRELKYRKQKQEFLIKSILEENHNPHQFSEYLGERKPNGENIDTWTLDELETEVEMFKCQLESKDPRLALKHAMDNIEIIEGDNKLYANICKTIKRPLTSIGKINLDVIIESVQVKEGGILTGKYLIYNIHSLHLKTKVVRTDTEFKWMYDTIKREVPFATPPPLILHPSRSFAKEQVDLTKTYYQRFLTELVSNQALKNSTTLDIFLTAQTKEEMTLKGKELEAYITKYVLIDRNVTKKKIDALVEDPILNIPTIQGKVVLKLSPHINTHISVLGNQLNAYEQVFDKIERVEGEIDKHYAKLGEFNLEISRLYEEIQQLAKAGNEIKNTIESVSEVEDSVYGAISTHFNNQCRVKSDYYRRPEETVQRVLKRLYALY